MVLKAELSTSEFRKLAFEKLSEAVLKDKGTGLTRVFGFNKNKQLIQASTTGCHASMGERAIKDSLYIANVFYKWDGKVVQHFLEWLTGPESVYSPIMRYLDKDYSVIKDDNGNIRGIICGTNVNTKILTNFFKSARTTSEHYKNLAFWEEFAIKQDLPFKGLTFLLMYFYRVNGDKHSNGHSCLESSWNTAPIALGRFLHPLKNNDWTLNTDLFSKSDTNYYGENAETWGLKPKDSKKKFIVHSSIPRLGDKKLVTFFYHHYDKRPAGSLSTKDLVNFYTICEEFA